MFVYTIYYNKKYIYIIKKLLLLLDTHIILFIYRYTILIQDSLFILNNFN